MFGGSGNGNPGFPAYVEENHFHYDMSVLPQLQLFGEVAVGGNVDSINCIGNEHGTATSRPMKRIRDPEPFSMQQKLHISLNSNFCQDDAGHAGSILNPNPVSTGLRLSYEEDERNSSVTSASENMKAVHPNLTYSLGSNLKSEIDRQKEQLEHFVKLQEGNLMKGVRELNQRHTASFLNALEKGAGKKLREKEVEIENINCKNKELEEKIKQVAMEAQSWQYRAKYNESIVNVLKSNLQQVIAQGAVQGREGYGDSEVDDAASYKNINITGSGNPVNAKQLSCSACGGKEVSVLLLPCRHLCLCKECEGLTDTCPVCQVVRTTTVHVFTS